MSISIYYTAQRAKPLSTQERKLIAAAVSRFTVEKLIDDHSLPKEGFNGEDFCIYDPEDPTEPGMVFEGTTKLPDHSQEATWSAVQYWCTLLGEVRRIVPDAEWRVHVDDHDIVWDAKAREYDPAH